MTYLYANFHDEPVFAAHAGMSVPELHTHIARRLCPDASYQVEANWQAQSFVATHSEPRTYRFHLRDHQHWLRQIQLLGITKEIGARRHFQVRYGAARDAFLSGDLWQRLTRAAPQVPAAFDAARDEATWDYFLQGFYGVCTRDGQPETIFLKQAGVMFIEAMTSGDPQALSPDDRALLAQVVALLDRVESDFAPHEVALSSRQRCIIDVRARFLRPFGLD
ncbi:hypothetical protein FNJ84_09530 [Paracoccus sp. M683]|uniref:DUF6058 family natural product biosynthesis protein n=1 Tax=Paracoccus sp. M683 TaxID=2594268 RepID=UPI00117D5CD7|nr:DUF6058 family natural product biosynthesis protein [Paracoccus sp. M683]TRW97716.1 hypothetical protein FNJ84_09530 [Paracoccus sp. M683]